MNDIAPTLRKLQRMDYDYKILIQKLIEILEFKNYDE